MTVWEREIHAPGARGHANVLHDTTRAGLLTPWRRHAEPEASAMRAALARVGEGVHSDNTREIVEAGLAEAPPSD